MADRHRTAPKGAGKPAAAAGTDSPAAGSGPATAPAKPAATASRTLPAAEPGPTIVKAPGEGLGKDGKRTGDRGGARPGAGGARPGAGRPPKEHQAEPGAPKPAGGDLAAKIGHAHDMLAEWLDAPELRLSHGECRAVATALVQLSETTGFRPVGPVWTVLGACTLLAGVYGGRIGALRGRLIAKRAKIAAPAASPASAARPDAASMPPTIAGAPGIDPLPFGVSEAEARAIDAQWGDGVHVPAGVPITSQADRDAPA